MEKPLKGEGEGELSLDKLSLIDEESSLLRDFLSDVVPDSKSEVFSDLVSVRAAVECFRAEGRDEETYIRPFLASLIRNRKAIFLQREFVLKAIVDKTLADLKTPPPKQKRGTKKMSTEEKEEKLKKQMENNERVCLELGIEKMRKKTREPIGNLMSGMKVTVVDDDATLKDVGPVQVLLFFCWCN